MYACLSFCSESASHVVFILEYQKQLKSSSLQLSDTTVYIFYYQKPVIRTHPAISYKPNLLPASCSNQPSKMKMLKLSCNAIALFVQILLLIQWQLSMAVLANHVPPKPATHKPKRAPRTLPPEASLSSGYYAATCPNLEAIIQEKVQAWVNTDQTLAASLIRLHLHDCAVRVISINNIINA